MPHTQPSLCVFPVQPAHVSSLWGECCSPLAVPHPSILFSSLLQQCGCLRTDIIPTWPAHPHSCLAVAAYRVRHTRQPMQGPTTPRHLSWPSASTLRQPSAVTSHQARALQPQHCLTT